MPTIIPDTEENRAALEHLYDRIKELNYKIAEFAKTPETLQLFISSNVKLLN